MMQNKQLAEQAEALNELLGQMITLLDEEVFDDIHERAAEAKQLLNQVISEYGRDHSDSSFILY